MTVTAEGGLAEDAVVELGSVTKAVTGLLLADAIVRGEVAPARRWTPACPAPGPGSRSRRSPPTPPGCRACRSPSSAATASSHDRPVRGDDGPRAGGGPRHVRIRRRGRPHYSNLGAALLGQALAARAGTSYEGLATPASWSRSASRRCGRRAARRPRSPTGAAGGPSPRGRSAPTRRPEPARHRARRARARHGLPGSAAPARRGRRARARPAPTASSRHGLGWLESGGMWWHNGGTNGSRAFVASGPRAAARSRRSPTPAARPTAPRWLSSTRSRARSSRGPGPPSRAGRRARRCPSRERRSPTGRPPTRRAGGRTSRAALERAGHALVGEVGQLARGQQLGERLARERARVGLADHDRGRAAIGRLVVGRRLPAGDLERRVDLVILASNASRAPPRARRARAWRRPAVLNGSRRRARASPWTWSATGWISVRSRGEAARASVRVLHVERDERGDRRAGSGATMPARHRAHSVTIAPPIRAAWMSMPPASSRATTRRRTLARRSRSPPRRPRRRGSASRWRTPRERASPGSWASR